MKTATDRVLATVRYLGSSPATFGLDADGATVTAERYYHGPMRRYRVVRVRVDGSTVSLVSACSQEIADHVVAAMA